MSDIAGRESPEMYLKAICLVSKEKGYCRHIDVARRLGISKPSVTVAIHNLGEEGFLEIHQNLHKSLLIMECCLSSMVV